jgi:hypothetical protein
MLARSEELDRFLGKKFPNLKRYGRPSRGQRKTDARVRGSREHVAGPRHFV